MIEKGFHFKSIIWSHHHYEVRSIKIKKQNYLEKSNKLESLHLPRTILATKVPPRISLYFKR